MIRTHIYIKGRHLYGLNLAKDYIRKQDYVIIVEGYFDLILPYQNEIRNIVATLGTALTPEQVGILKRFTKNFIMVYNMKNMILHLVYHVHHVKKKFYGSFFQLSLCLLWYIIIPIFISINRSRVKTHLCFSSPYVL